MIEAPVSQHLEAVQTAAAPFIRFLTTSPWAKRMGSPEICDFVAGNPQDMPLPEYVDAIRRASLPQNPSWFAYKANEPAARDVVARSLHDRLDIPFDPEDVFMTKGASTALAIALATVVSPGEEVVFLSPPWFFYESMIAFARGVPVRVKVDLESFDLDVDAIAAALS
ncbi:MAG: aminotransferase class I/II-fold pyridoxal phosphate-dependent enzyme, partial [Actinomycetota bacterium]|nr:aminotransferase class I/II-fold pyridoxal phosphate-dependent enzyme [Actinomycetota bacterium]